MYIVEFRPNVYSLLLLVGMCMSPYMRHGPIQEMQYVSVRLPYPDTEGAEGAQRYGSCGAAWAAARGGAGTAYMRIYRHYIYMLP